MKYFIRKEAWAYILAPTTLAELQADLEGRGHIIVTVDEANGRIKFEHETERKD
jgi:hypothetical protein